MTTTTGDAAEVFMIVCCRTPVAYPTPGINTTCPECGSIFEASTNPTTEGNPDMTTTTDTIVNRNAVVDYLVDFAEFEATNTAPTPLVPGAFIKRSVHVYVGNTDVSIADDVTGAIVRFSGPVPMDLFRMVVDYAEKHSTDD